MCGSWFSFFRLWTVYLPFVAGAGRLLPRRLPDLVPGTVLGPLGGRGLFMVIPLKAPMCGMPSVGAGHADRDRTGLDVCIFERKSDSVKYAALVLHQCTKNAKCHSLRHDS